MSEINVYLKNNEAKECCFFTYNYLEHSRNDDRQRGFLFAFIPEREVEPHARQHVGPEHHRKDEDTLAEF